MKFGRIFRTVLLSTLAILPIAPKDAWSAAHKPTAGRARAHTATKKSTKKSTNKPAHRVVRSRSVSTYTRGGLPNIQARGAVILDLSASPSGVALYQKNPDEARPIASISKLMSMLVVLEHKLNLTGQTTILQSDAKLTTRGAKSRLLVGMTLSNLDLLHAALMASDNRAVLALGRAVGLEPSAFAEAMNVRSKSLGLKKTHFGDPTGLDYRNVSTPREVIAMLQAALKQPLIAQIVRTTQHVARSTTKPRDSVEYSNTDLLLRGSRHHIHGGKTGYNDQAGYCFVVAARVQVPSREAPMGKPREVAMAFLGEEGKLTRFADFDRAAQWLVERAPTAITAAAPTQRAMTTQVARPPLL